MKGPEASAGSVRVSLLRWCALALQIPPSDIQITAPFHARVLILSIGIRGRPPRMQCDMDQGLRRGL